MLNVKITDKEFFPYSSIKFSPGITILVGCNGAGKTTLLQNINDMQDKCLYLDNRRENAENTFQMMAGRDTVSLASSLIFCSEGEALRENIAVNFAPRIGKFVTDNPKLDKLVILFDAIDSGLSIDNILELKEFFSFLLSDIGKETYIIVAANTYEMVAGEECVDVQTGKKIRFNNYDEYKNFVLESRKRKEEA